MENIDSQDGGTLSNDLSVLQAEILRLQRLVDTSLNSTHSIEAQLNSPPPAISSPAYEIEPKELSINSPIAFIHNRIDVVPGIIRNINPDNTYDLEVYIPVSNKKIVFNQEKTSFETVPKIELVSQPRTRARFCDVRTIFRKQMTELTTPQKGTEGIIQTHIDTYLPGTIVRVPRFHDFHTSLVGTFFDPSLYLFKVFCWRASQTIMGENFPAEQVVFPAKKPYYTEFAKTYNRFFKEYHQGMGKGGNKWNRVEIQVFLREDNLDK
jgi:hypothetical protein